MPNQVVVKAQRLHEDAKLPVVKQEGDVAADLFALERTVVPADGKALVRTGIAIELPPGYRARFHSRSGMSAKHDIEVGAGLIDNSYRDELKVVLRNFGERRYVVEAGDRIAQVCIEQYEEPVFEEVTSVAPTERTAGFGSSGR